ncbi:MAG: ABC transporter permease [Clostridiales bacterium]|nr:ABC transporter permease [Clostridiales bacterium]
MRGFIVRRLLLLLPTILAIIFIVFFVTSLTPGSPGRIILGPNAEQVNVDAINHELGFDKPFYARYVDYVINVFKGDLGKTYFTNKPVIDEIISRFPVTFNLAVYSLFFSCIIGIPLGVFSAVKQYSIIDYLGTTLAILLAVVPTFWFALVLILFFSLELKMLPSSGASSSLHYVMPVIVTALPAIASILRMTRTTMLETIRSDYVRTARAKGINENKVVWYHAFKNALLPVVTIIGMNFGFTIGGTVITESIFSLPGLGLLTINSIRNKDIPQVMGIVLFFSLLFLLIMLLIDILYAYLDPRIKATYDAKEETAIRKGTFFKRSIRRIKRLV